MATQPKPAIIVRNTAQVMRDILQVPIQAMMRDDVPVGSMIVGLDPTDPKNEQVLFSIDESATREPNQHYGEPFHMVMWAAKKIELRGDDDQETIPHVRVVLIDNNGETLSFVSQGVLSSLDLIRTTRGDGPYDPPLPIIVVENKTRQGFRVFKLRIHVERKPADKKS